MPFATLAVRPMTLGLVPSGDPGIAATLRAMSKLSRDGRKDPLIIQTASALVADLPQYDKMGEVKALHAYVRDHIRYTSDPVNLELLRTPRAVIEMGVGDCDDKCVLLAALLLAIGLPARFVAVALAPSKVFSHVLVETRRGQGWMPLETIKPVAAGWGPPNVTRRMVAHV